MSDDHIQCIEGAFSADECDALIRLAEGLGFEAAPITTSRGFVMRPDIRDNTRVILDDLPRAAGLWERLGPFLPASAGPLRAVGLNERFRFYRYAPGQKFDWHHDGAYHRDNGEQSLLTLMIYLNEGFMGGTTDFSLVGEAPLQIVPARGRVLVFEHGLRHRGAPVVSGVKYVLRTDVMYRPDAAMHGG